MGNIRDKEAHNKIRVDWEFENDCFPRKIRPTDIDGFTEINGYPLIQEHKSQNQEIPYGQEEAYKRICARNNNFLVLVFWADLNQGGNPIKVYRIKTFFGKNGNLSIKEHNPSIENIRNLIKSWIKIVENPLVE